MAELLHFNLYWVYRCTSVCTWIFITLVQFNLYFYLLNTNQYLQDKWVTTVSSPTSFHLTSWPPENVCLTPLFTLPDQWGLSSYGGAPVHLHGSLLSITHPTLASPLHLLPPLVPLHTITHSMTNDRLSLPRYQKAPATSKWSHFGSPVLPVLIGGRAVPLAVLRPPLLPPPSPPPCPPQGV